MRSEYFPTFLYTKRVKLNLLIPLQKLKKDTFKLFLHIYRSKNIHKKLLKDCKEIHYDFYCLVRVLL